MPKGLKGLGASRRGDDVQSLPDWQTLRTLAQEIHRVHDEHGVPTWQTDDSPLQNRDRFYLSGYVHGKANESWRPDPDEVSDEMIEVWMLGFEDGQGDRDEKV